MKSKRNLMTALVGLAMLATPLTAAAYDNNHAHNHANAAHQTHSFAAPTHNFAAHNGAAFANHPFRNGVAARDWRANHALADANAYSNYGRGYANPGYVAAAPAYVQEYPAVAVPYNSGYAGGGYAGAGNVGGGNGCGRAQRVVNNYYRDRNTGHPAAAYDLLVQNRWAFRSGCTGGAPVTGNGGLLGGLGGFGGAPAYNRGAYNGGYAQPGYAQPYGGGTSMLAPLLQYIR